MSIRLSTELNTISDNVKAAAEAAIEALNGYELEGRSINVNEARPKENRGGGGGGYRR